MAGMLLLTPGKRKDFTASTGDGPLFSAAQKKNARAIDPGVLPNSELKTVN